ncbi:hypothetical protein [Dictyobacter vulcani]|nr:hypothetical protein [Dictyobacter vulcani]
MREKENEISALKEMLTPDLIKGRTLSADAMYTQRFFASTSLGVEASTCS